MMIRYASQGETGGRLGGARTSVMPPKAGAPPINLSALNHPELETRYRALSEAEFLHCTYVKTVVSVCAVALEDYIGHSVPQIPICSD